MVTEVTAPLAPAAHAGVEANAVSRAFGSKLALQRVSLRIEPGQIHALLGPNGAGKTTLLRILTGGLLPDEGTVSVMGVRGEGLVSKEYRRIFGLVPSGDRTFYLRLSGFENLLFFARLHGLSKRAAGRRAREALGLVDLADVGDEAVNAYSHGMQKRLSVARALLADPPVLFVDEATHDLDPEAASRIHGLVKEASRRGTTVLWATQRIEEIRGFADGVTLLHRGEVRFQGSVPAFLAAVPGAGFLVHVQPVGDVRGSILETAIAAVGTRAQVRAAGDSDDAHLVVSLPDGAVLGEALWALRGAGLEIVGVREERPGVEQAFIWFTSEVQP
jgi:ABC-2 type transport system ATP-binding protein